MKYYAYIDGNQEGPFDLNELISVGVRPSTFIWCKTMDDWHRADEVEEVRELFRHHLGQIDDAKRSVAPSEHQQEKNDQYPDTEDEGPDLSDIPPRFRYYVKKSGTVPGPPKSLEPDINQAPQISMVLAVISMVICFFPAGIASVVYTYKSQKAWHEAMELQRQGQEATDLKTQAHEYARLAKMWLGLAVALGIIAWTLLFSIK